AEGRAALPRARRRLGTRPAPAGGVAAPEPPLAAVLHPLQRRAALLGHQRRSAAVRAPPGLLRAPRRGGAPAQARGRRLPRLADGGAAGRAAGLLDLPLSRDARAHRAPGARARPRRALLAQRRCRRGPRRRGAVRRRGAGAAVKSLVLW